MPGTNIRLYDPALVEGHVWGGLRHHEFVNRAEAIIRDLENLRSEWGLKEALSQIWEKYVEAETEPDLRRFGEVIADARRQATTQRQLDEDREQLHHGHLRHDELVMVGHHYDTLRRQACIYNHLLRGVIEHYGEEVTRDELTGWLTSASLGVSGWAIGEITGAVSEYALHAALNGLPELSGVRHGTVEEDLHGYDFVANYEGQMVTLDAKTGLYRPLTERKHGHRHMEISVPREAVDGFKLTRHGLDVLRSEVRQALHAEPWRGADHYRGH